MLMAVVFSLKRAPTLRGESDPFPKIPMHC